MTHISRPALTTGAQDTWFSVQFGAGAAATKCAGDETVALGTPFIIPASLQRNIPVIFTPTAQLNAGVTLTFWEVRVMSQVWPSECASSGRRLAFVLRACLHRLARQPRGCLSARHAMALRRRRGGERARLMPSTAAITCGVRRLD